MRILFVLVMLTVSWSFAQSGCTDPVKMPDAQLKQVILQTLGVSGKAIRCSDIQTLQVLDASDKGIRNIKGLEWAENLVFLNLSSNAVVALKPLAGLVRLTNLNLGNNQIVGLAHLSDLDNLKFLDLSGNQIVSILPLLQNEGLNAGDTVSLTGNCLSGKGLSTTLETLSARGVTVLASAQKRCN